MSNEIFKWMPHLEQYSDASEHSVLRTTFENGITQRRRRWGRKKGYWKFNYQMNMLSMGDATLIIDGITTFFDARYGSYDNFFLPSWKFESRLTQQLAQGGTTLYLSKDPVLLGFSATLGAQGNFVYVADRYALNYEVEGRHYVGRIESINSGNKTITVTSALFNSGGALAANSVVMKAYRVNFVNDKLERAFQGPYLWKQDIEFEEDIGALYL